MSSAKELQRWVVEELGLIYNLHYGRYMTIQGEHLPPDDSPWFWPVVADVLRKHVKRSKPSHFYQARVAMAWLDRGGIAFCEAVRATDSPPTPV